tara:strand:+ start:10 stop:834 length:825 start_codon:yes stop_codon:yes gene_type:complete
MQENNSFITFDNNKTGLIFDDSKHETYPIRYYNTINGKGFKTKENCSYHGYIYEGDSQLYYKQGNKEINLNLTSGMFFSCKDGFTINGDSKIVIIEVLHTKGIYPKTNYQAYNTIGGPIEKSGRLRYIDGCTDSLLIAPVKWGDPCLNHLHFPKDIRQTQHTHPSHRIGIVSSGSGLCVTPFGNLPLIKGMIFVIKEWDGVTFATGLDNNQHPIGEHSFNTDKESLDVIAFHPDSDFGATDVEHPMINRTYVDGKSVKTMTEIMTNEEQFNNQD